MWISYNDDEVLRFHPEFQKAAEHALGLGGLTTTYEWVHHLRTPGNTIVPDFVLRERATKRWRLCVELKRSVSSVYSTRNQIQAKGYAEANADHYAPGVPQYWAIGNLETTLLFALNGGLPPRQCRVEGGRFDSARFSETDALTFAALLSETLRALVNRALSPGPPLFDELWPRVTASLISTADRLVISVPSVQPTSPHWALVASFFCNTPVDANRVFLLRCLLSEYLRGLLARFAHPSAGHLIPLSYSSPKASAVSLANAWARVREVDFRQLFEEEVIEFARTRMPADQATAISEYVRDISVPPTDIERHARERLDSADLVDQVANASHAGLSPDDRGKVVTDPELAALVAHLAVPSEAVRVCDPCCGDGALLDAVYDRLASQRSSHNDALGCLCGLEADPLLARLAALRVLLRQPASVDSESRVDITQADMFASADILGACDVIVMNPPFRRYEAQSSPPVPPALKAHFAGAISGLDGVTSVSTAGQQNLYSYFVEFAVKCARPQARLGIILDNKWYHNAYGRPLREFLLRHCEIEALVEYPFAGLFSDWTIATSLLICRKVEAVAPDALVRFIRCGVELSRVNTKEVSEAYFEGGPWPPFWRCRTERQADLDPSVGWKTHFGDSLELDYRVGLPQLGTLFSYSRRGSLAKEEGGRGALAFPFSRKIFGHKRTALGHPGRRGQNTVGKKLSVAENKRLRELATAVPEEYRGYAIENTDTPVSYLLDPAQLFQQPTPEPPALRGLDSYRSRSKVPWTKDLDAGLGELMAQPEVAAFVSEFRATTGITTAVMDDRKLWIGLREPVAGELIIARKHRVGLRLFINPYAWQTGRQVRISSNAVAFMGCKAVDELTPRSTATRVIAAFLLSSFGQLQLEMKGYNREGCLSLEKDHLDQVVAIDPRQLTAEEREATLKALSALPFPIRLDAVSASKPEQQALDQVFARAICRSHADWEPDSLLLEVHRLLDEYVLARQS